MAIDIGGDKLRWATYSIGHGRLRAHPEDLAPYEGTKLELTARRWVNVQQHVKPRKT